MRGDIARLSRCTAVTTQSEDTIKRSKPFKYAYEKEIVMYAYFKKLTYFSTECIYSPDGVSSFWYAPEMLIAAYRGHARVFLKDLEAVRPSAIVDIIHSGESFVLEQAAQKSIKALRESQSHSSTRIAHKPETCLRCGYMSSNDLCVCLPSPLPLVHCLTDSESMRSFARSRSWSGPECIGKRFHRNCGIVHD
jgi:cytoplasmic tRNA 2-thiolation protein 1